MSERTVYILLTRSGTWFSRLIHLATQDRYTHASIGLDGPSGPFYSFARKYRYLALPAGLVEEHVTIYRREVPCCLYALTVSEETYLRLRRQLRSMYDQREEYHYSVLGVLACWFHLSFQRRHHYFCSQFVAGLLEECGAVELPKPPTLLRPAELCQLNALQTVHQGPLAGILAAPAA
ncbi:hypothetical protein D1646_20105 [Pseudoflavonifractor sp. 60]|uniref:hypothetical protein n=1 Tax=Pseudoflavonifractor sp. 60 TaxID=2304576 RepID=UPI00136BB1CB|nr:hypothetical protein [Pseudoflavonifractor sp. 60]NBI69043.1 hypothetical protein [Pseudoflavonifractor sp. 60]